ncbi:hypothetical protein FOA52_010171 [Chlamydomonas sp. UWO 241]|nr:hypothetical protein FOA52_010171 [Chlamydomonas sp. UWO 241]
MNIPRKQQASQPLFVEFATNPTHLLLLPRERGSMSGRDSEPKGASFRKAQGPPQLDIDISSAAYGNYDSPASKGGWMSDTVGDRDSLTSMRSGGIGSKRSDPSPRGVAGQSSSAGNTTDDEPVSPAHTYTNAIYEDDLAAETAATAAVLFAQSPQPLGALPGMAGRTFKKTQVLGGPAGSNRVKPHGLASGRAATMTGGSSASEAYGGRVMTARGDRMMTPAPSLAVAEGEAMRELNWNAITRTPDEYESDMLGLLRAGDKAAAVDMQAPREGFIRCVVVRKSGMLGMTRTYELRTDAPSDTFLMLGAMWHYEGCKAPSYCMTLMRKSTSVNQGMQLNSNREGNEYALRNPGASRVHIGLEQKKNSDMAMSVIVRLPDAGSERSHAQPARPARSMRTNLNKFDEIEGSTMLVKRSAYPNNASPSNVFEGRTPMPSLKNFQLVRWCDHEEPDAPIVLQMCKLSDKKYALDLAHPLTPETAFAVALANFGRNGAHAK